jgi:uncharacterized membrane protein
MYPLLLFIHVSAVAVWVGGMFFSVFCLGPALAGLDAPKRVAAAQRALERFLTAVSLAILAILGSGLGMLLPVGLRYAPLSWHLMGGMGLVMIALYGHIVFGPFRRAQAAAAREDWPAAGAALEKVRRWVIINLILGLGTIAVATIGRLMT